MKKDRYYSKRQLEKNVRKMGEIIMIGAIASIENSFGFLWGKDKQSSYTEDEEKAFEIWENLRKEILDKGNSNIEKTVGMLDSFTVYMDKPGTTVDFRKREK